ncbi:hypothetical protein Q7P37_007421 [Cladosporium fusiforme]
MALFGFASAGPVTATQNDTVTHARQRVQFTDMLEVSFPSTVAVNEFKSKWEILKKSEDERHELFEKLFEQLSKAVSRNETLQEKVKDLEHGRDSSVTQNRKLNEDLTLLQDKLNASPFVLVLIDGDNTFFLDEMVAAGAEGGHRAAQRLNCALEAYGRSSFGLQTHWEIVVRIYFNRTGLIKTYADANIVERGQVMEDFIVGFNRELPFIEFIDAGPDKEAADTKIKGDTSWSDLRLHFADSMAANINMHRSCASCKHIMVAGSADQGYVNFLRQFSDVDQSRSRLALIESIPFPASFRQLAVRFPVNTLPDVFRTTKIVVPNRLRQAPASTAVSYAGAATRSGASSNALRLSPVTVPNGQSRTMTPSLASRRSMRFNRHGQRLDDPLPKFDKHLVEALRQRRLCRRFFLTQCTIPGCIFSHEGELSNAQKRALTRIAKETPCSNGTRCEDRDCVAAHECVYRDKCDWGDCRYGPDMHDVDRTVATTDSVAV